jgi:small subunit ribosomal protein S21
VRRNRNNNDDPFIKGLKVEVRNGDVDFALRKFKKKVQEAGILQELRERQQYEKPSMKRKKAKAAARARWLKKLSKMDQDLSHTPSRKRK